MIIESEALTEPDNEEYMVMGGKRVPSSSYDPRFVDSNLFN